MGSGGFSESSGGGSQRQEIASLSPITGLFGQAFGIPVGTGFGGLQFQGRVPQITPQLFGPGTFQPLGDVFEPINIPRVDVSQILDLTQTGLGTVQEAAQTGLIEPATALAQDLFGDFINQASEQFGSRLGIGFGDTDFESIIAGEARRGALELANLAQDRRLAASQVLGDQVGQALGIQAQLPETVFAGTPAGQVLNRLLALAGIPTQGQSVGQGFNEFDSLSVNAGLK